MSSRNGHSAPVLDEEVLDLRVPIVEIPAPPDTVEVEVTTVALAGTATSSRDLVHQQGADVAVWGLNASYDWMPRFDRWFEMHDRDRYDHIQGDHLAKLAAMECPVVMVKHYDDIPNSVAYPIEAVTQDRFRPLFTSSVAYMLGLAIAEGFTEIRLMGIDMSMDSEYAYQRSACEYWLGIADALGIKVVIPESSPIGKAPLYGMQTKDGDRRIHDMKDTIEVERLRKFEEYITSLKTGLDEFIASTHLYEGALQVLMKMQQGDR